MIVLDTHIWVWWVDGSERLTKKHREYIEKYQCQGLGVSIVSCWEVAKLVEKNRLVFSCPVNEWLETDAGLSRSTIIKFDPTDSS
jgi:PIN domain nuclease of toxin-antitoxin system